MSICKLVTKLLQLQAAAQASYYLPSYDSRQVASAISLLRDQIEAAKKTHLGKKKFGFSRKPKKMPASQSMAPMTEPQTNHAEASTNQQDRPSARPPAHSGPEYQPPKQLR